MRLGSRKEKEGKLFTVSNMIHFKCVYLAHTLGVQILTKVENKNVHQCKKGLQFDSLQKLKIIFHGEKNGQIELNLINCKIFVCRP